MGIENHFSKSVLLGEKEVEYIPIRVIDIAGQKYVEGVLVDRNVKVLKSVRFPLEKAENHRFLRTYSHIIRQRSPPQ